MSSNEDGPGKKRGAMPPPPPPGRALGSIDSIRERMASLPEAQGVISGARSSPPSQPPATGPVGPAGPSSKPPTRTDLPALAPARRKGKTDLSSDAPEGEDGAEVVDADEIDISLDALLEETAGDSGRPGAIPVLPAICMFGRFEVLGRIAFGGMAEIFLGREDTHLGTTRHLAIKRILPHVADDEAFVEMFLDEARLAIQLNHPNICHIYEFGELDGSYFIAMEWINGVPLGKLIRKARLIGGLPPEIAVRILATIAASLDYAHRARDALGRPLEIVHRDVSPHNVMVAYGGQLKLLDFGIAKASTHASKTAAGTVKGKFSYMAPEQCLNRELDGRVDIFALGICLWETLTGKALYTRDNEFETMKAIIELDPPSIRTERSDLPEGLDPIVRKALAKKPDDRYQTAGELQNALERWLADAGHVVNAGTIADLMNELYEDQIRRGPLVDSTPFGESFRRTSPKTPASHPSYEAQVPSTGTAPAAAVPPAKRPVWLFALIAALVVALGAVSLFALWPDPEPPPQVASEPVPEEPVVVEEPDPEPVEPVEPPPEEAPVALGTLIVESTPSRGTVTVDGEAIAGHTPLTLARLTAGSHHVTVERTGYGTYETDVEVVGDGEVSVSANLRSTTEVRPNGQLSINTRPWSKVYLGRRLLGTTPIAEVSVQSGRVRLRLVDRDGNTHTKNVRVPAGRTERVFYDLSE